MEYILFFLNICLTVGMSTSVASAYFLNRVRGGKVFVALGFLFFIYLVDNTIVFMTEVIPSFAASYNTIFVSSPVFKAVLHIGMIYCYMYIHKQILRKEIRSFNLVLLFLYSMVLLTSNFFSNGAVGSWIFYASNSTFYVGLAIFGLLRVINHPQSYRRKFYRLYKKLAIFTIVIGICVLAEDTYVIFNVDDYTSETPRIFNRNFSENIMLIVYSLSLLRYTRLVLKNSDMNIFGPVLIPPSNIISTTDAFCHMYSLTDRERDVLHELMEGLSITEISEKLYISQGTVKTHIHNLYRKTDVGKKSELLRKYKDFESNLQQGVAR